MIVSRSKSVRRPAGGNITAVTAVCGMMAAVFVSTVVYPFCSLMVCKSVVTNAAEAASLAAAVDLSRVVVNDPDFGFVALGDLPAGGKATDAPDGRRLPVVGINTIIGTARLDTAIAFATGNSDLLELAEINTQKAKRAASKLEDALMLAITDSCAGRCKDADGNVVDVYGHAKSLYNSNLPPGYRSAGLIVGQLSLSLGYLEGGSSTVTPLPQPQEMAFLKDVPATETNYKAFVNFPIGKQDYYFTGLGKQAGLVDSSRFRDLDGQRICSIVRATATMTYKTRSINGDAKSQVVKAVACAQPGAAAERQRGGTLVLSFPNGVAPEIRSLNDLLTNLYATTSKVDNYYCAEGGDYPSDSPAHLARATSGTGNLWPSTSQVMAQGLFDWLRCLHLRPRIDSFVEFLNNHSIASLSGSAGEALFFEVDETGKIVKLQPSNSWAIGHDLACSEAQRYALSFDAFAINGRHWALESKDNVFQSGLLNGGKHGGQIIDAGYQTPNSRGIAVVFEVSTPMETDRPL